MGVHATQLGVYNCEFVARRRIIRDDSIGGNVTVDRPINHPSDWNYRELPAGWVIITETDDHTHIVLYWSVRHSEGVWWSSYRRMDAFWSGADL